LYSILSCEQKGDFSSSPPYDAHPIECYPNTVRTDLGSSSLIEFGRKLFIGKGCPFPSGQLEDPLEGNMRTGLLPFGLRGENNGVYKHVHEFFTNIYRKIKYSMYVNTCLHKINCSIDLIKTQISL